MRLSELEKLSAQRLKEIKTKIDFLLLSQNIRYAEDDSDLLIFYNSITTEIYKRIKRVQLDLHVKRKRHKHSYKKIIEVKGYLEDYLKEIIDEDVTKIMLKKWYIIYSKIVCDYIFFIEKNKPLTVDNVLRYYNIFPELLDKEYPEYINNGLVKLIL